MLAKSSLSGILAAAIVARADATLIGSGKLEPGFALTLDLGPALSEGMTFRSPDPGGGGGVDQMAKAGNRVHVKLRSTESPHRYYTRKNKRNTTNRLELRKYDPVVRRHVLYKEEK